MAKQLLICCLISLATIVSGAGLSLDELIAEQTQFRPAVSLPDSLKLEASALLRQDVINTSPHHHGHTAKNILNLAQKIGEALMASRSEKVFVYSPVAIAAALQLVLLGANGETYNELLKLLSTDNSQTLHEDFAATISDLLATNFDDVNDSNVKTNQIAAGAGSVDHRISVVNGLFVQNGYSIRPNYRTVVESIYSSEITELDFERYPENAVSFINNWVEKSTNGKVKNIVQSLSRDTRVIVASTLYFNARWKQTFHEAGTRPREFYPDGHGGRSIMVDMMSFGGKLPYYDAKEYDCKIIGFPYKNNLSTFYIIIPNDSTPQKLRDLQRDLSPDMIDYMISRMTMNTSILFLPKMHLTSDFRLRDILYQLGITTLFDPARADLSLITDRDAFGNVGRTLPLTQSGGFAAPSVPLRYENREDVLIFSRLRGDDDDDEQAEIKDASNDTQKTKNARKKRATYKVASKYERESEPLRLKDFVLRKRITKPYAEKKLSRPRRQISALESLQEINQLRGRVISNPGLYASEVVHKVDLTINEKGTEGGAAVLVLLHKTGTDVVLRVDVPFMFLIRNEATKLPLFYGTIFEPPQPEKPY
ncbi:serine protease inhibitor 28Dc [Phlebotomus argentipes]|uniref:serine protease inhibitor 28Dc n=1 Tax=Phlebotomus argentipes TaxID=94469 RepID=UPI0028932A36|nr:serine protease inhibitor 28Dc [Phlebotomus argentipes]XP_059619213.1 serine protease inhibitor 28Dc [Phlebotomus argentipes]